MCHHANGDVLPTDKDQMVAVEVPQRVGRPTTATNGVNGTHNKPMNQKQINPYAPRASDFLSNISNFNIIESTLRGLSTSLKIFKSLLPGLITSIEQKENNSLMLFSTLRPKSLLLRRSMRSVLNISSSHHPLHRSSQG